MIVFGWCFVGVVMVFGLVFVLCLVDVVMFGLCCVGVWLGGGWILNRC